MSSKCIVCGDEFTSQRYGTRFCQKPGCRQKFNRQERGYKRAAADIGNLITQLMRGTKEEHFAKLSRQLLLESEKLIKARLDEIAPERNPKPKAVFDARRIQAADLKMAGEYWALPADGGDLLPVKLIDIQGAFYECEILNDKNQYGNRAPRYLIPSSTIFVEITERGVGGSAPAAKSMHAADVTQMLIKTVLSVDDQDDFPEDEEEGNWYEDEELAEEIDE